MNRAIVGSFCVAALALAGCGGDEIRVLGSWRAAITSPDGPGTLVLTYNADHTFREEALTMYAATAAMNAGCTERSVGAGSYRVAGNSIIEDFTTLGVGRSGCALSTNNTAYSESTNPSGRIVGTYSFTVSGTRLTRTPLGGVSTTFVME